MKFRILLGAMVMMMASLATTAIGLAGTASIASADSANSTVNSPRSTPICGSHEGAVGADLSGTYHNLTVTQTAYVRKRDTLKVTGNLTLAPGACLDAFSLGTVVVGHNVTVEKGATLALGCAPGSNGPPGIRPCGYSVANDTVGGNITADQPLTMYLTAVTVGGNVISEGGGFSAPGLSFPVKSMNIGGNLVLQGWTGGPGAWIGALRNQVAGNVVVSDNVGHRPGDDGIANDSTEIDGNTVGHNLVCENNTPPAQYGDAYNPAEGNGPNVVGHEAIGECADLTTPPTAS